MHLLLTPGLCQLFRTDLSELVAFRKPDAFVVYVEADQAATADVDLHYGNLRTNTVSGRLHWHLPRSSDSLGSAGMRANAALLEGYASELAFRGSFGTAR
jgi:hypothetical protein